MKFTLRSTYIATGRSTVEYVAVPRLPGFLLSTLVKLVMCQRYAGGAITGQVSTTPAETILAEADLPTVVTRATQLCTIAMVKSDRMLDTNPIWQIATTKVHQNTKKTSRRKTASEACRYIFGSMQPERTPGFLPPWLQTGNHVFEADGARSGDAEKDKEWAQWRLAKDYSFMTLPSTQMVR